MKKLRNRIALIKYYYLIFIKGETLYESEEDAGFIECIPAEEPGSDFFALLNESR